MKQELTNTAPVIVPAHEVHRQEGRVMVSIEMPGLTQQDVEIVVENQQLLVSGLRRAEAADGIYLVRERRFGRYERVFNLDETIDTDRIDAKMRNGVLTLTLPVKEAAKPRKIAITAR